MKITNNKMKSYFKRPLAITAVLLSVISLVGCDGGNNASLNESSTEAESKAESTADEKPLNIVIDKNGDTHVESGSEASQDESESDAAADENSENAAEPEVTANGDDESEAASSVLDSLKGIPAGTVLSSDQIDFDNIDKYFTTFDIEEGDAIYNRINGKSYRANDYVPLSSLVYLKLPHYNFNGEIQVGEIIVCRDIIDDVKNVFKELFEAQYQIESMHLVDNYWTGDPDSTDSASIDVNNTSSFCYRNSTGGGNLSQHAYGRAIDLNPQQNPYVSYSSGSPKWSHSNANDYIDRSSGLAHVITHEDTAYKIFTKYGFTWGGDWDNPKDYQHFQKKK